VSGLENEGASSGRDVRDVRKEAGRRPTRSPAALLLLPAAGLVTAVLLVLRVRLEPPTVPLYVLAPATTGDAERASDKVLGPSDPFHLALEPRAAVEGAVAARGFLLRGEDVRAWDPPFTVERDGTVRLDGTVETLFAGIPRGPWDIAIAVGRPETLPTAPRDILRARDAGAGDAAWRLVRHAVVLGP
jgi:hypothetical protein